METSNLRFHTFLNNLFQLCFVNLLRLSSHVLQTDSVHYGRYFIVTISYDNNILECMLSYICYEGQDSPFLQQKCFKKSLVIWPSLEIYPPYRSNSLNTVLNSSVTKIRPGVRILPANQFYILAKILYSIDSCLFLCVVI